MITYGILLALFALLVVASFVLFLFVVIKKRNKLLPVAAVLLGVGLCGVAVSSYKFTKASIAYANSQEAQNLIKKGAEKAGETAGNVISGAANGLNKAVTEEDVKLISEKTGLAISKTLSTTVKGLEKDFDEKPIYVSKALEAEGLTILSSVSNPMSNATQLLITSNSKISDAKPLFVTAYDKNNNKLHKEKSSLVSVNEIKTFTFILPISDMKQIAFFTLTTE